MPVGRRACFKMWCIILLSQIGPEIYNTHPLVQCPAQGWLLTINFYLILYFHALYSCSPYSSRPTSLPQCPLKISFPFFSCPLFIFSTSPSFFFSHVLLFYTLPPLLSFLHLIQLCMYVSTGLLVRADLEVSFSLSAEINVPAKVLITRLRVEGGGGWGRRRDKDERWRWKQARDSGPGRKERMNAREGKGKERKGMKGSVAAFNCAQKSEKKKHSYAEMFDKTAVQIGIPSWKRR